MASNRRRHANAVPIASLATWVVVAAFFCFAGLGYVYCKNQLHARGRQIDKLERELAEVLTQNEVVRAKIASLSATAVLQRRLNEGFIHLAPISDDRIIRIGRDKEKSREEDDLRAVSNERGRE